MFLNLGRIGGAGRITFMNFNSTTGLFSLVFVVQPASVVNPEAPTEIFINEKVVAALTALVIPLLQVHYANGYNVTITPLGAARWKRSREVRPAAAFLDSR